LRTLLIALLLLVPVRSRAEPPLARLVLDRDGARWTATLSRRLLETDRGSGDERWEVTLTLRNPHNEQRRERFVLFQDQHRSRSPALVPSLSVVRLRGRPLLLLRLPRSDWTEQIEARLIDPWGPENAVRFVGRHRLPSLFGPRCPTIVRTEIEPTDDGNSLDWIIAWREPDSVRPRCRYSIERRTATRFRFDGACWTLAPNQPLDPRFLDAKDRCTAPPMH